MNKAAMSLALIAITMVAARGQEGVKTTAPAKPIAQLAWLVGGVWTAGGSKIGSGMQRIETRYAWSDNAAYIRFTTHFVMDKGTFKNYDGSFFWDPERASLAMWYMDAQNSITQGPVLFEGDTMQMTFRAHDFEGKLADLRVKVTRKTNDDYNWLLEEKGPEGWKQLATLEYLRVAGT
jgi:hypothetical protein